MNRDLPYRSNVSEIPCESDEIFEFFLWSAPLNEVLLLSPFSVDQQFQPTSESTELVVFSHFRVFWRSA
jgi:hypothetical protein